MKKFTKLLGIVLIIALVMSMGISSAFAAAGTPSITIKPNDTQGAAKGDITITYTYYKILTADIDTDPTVGLDGAATAPGVVAYYVTDFAQATAIAGLKKGDNAIFNVTKVEGTNKWYVELNKETAASADDIVTAFNNDTFLANFTAKTFKNEDGGDAVITDVEKGYYFIKSSLGSKMAVQTLSPVTINEKNQYVTDDKTIPETDKNSEIGQDITYTLTVNVPATATEQIVLTDTMSKGLTFKQVKSQKIGTTDMTNTQKGTVSELSDAENGAKKFTITYTADQVKALVEDGSAKVITIEVIATVNEEAAIDTDIPNTLDLKYGNNYDAKPKTVNTKVTHADFNKVDGTDSSVQLSGAEFKLTKESANTKDSTSGWINLVEVEAGKTYRIATTNDTTTTDTIKTNGSKVTINGLDLDVTYYLVETKAPTGYNILDKHVDLVGGGTSFAHQDVENNKGAQLPSTGGIGTTIFYVVGSIMVVAAGVLLITKKRMSREG